MTPKDYETAAFVARKYAAAVEKKLYWSMSLSEAHDEINEAERIAEMLESEARNREIR